jgi:hypothetical protein
VRDWAKSKANCQNCFAAAMAMCVFTLSARWTEPAQGLRTDLGEH